MNKGIRLVKKMVALFLVLFLSIESFAAVVSDNDGSAFITKAEFDSLKNNFQSQIDQYNISIDQKIDGAIASYLAGIKTTSTESSKILVDNYSDMIWVNDYKVYGRWKKWTSAAGYSSADMTKRWFTPSLNEKRMTFRNVGMSWYSIMSQAWSLVVAYLGININSGTNGVAVAATTGWARESFSAAPVLILRAVKDSDESYNIVKVFNVYSMGVYGVSKDHRFEASTGIQAYQWGNNGAMVVTSVDILDKESTDIIKYKVTNNGYYSDTGSRFLTGGTYTDTLTPANFQFPAAWCDDEHNGGPTVDKFDTANSTPISTGYTASNYFDTGCTWHNLDQLSAQNTFLQHMMLGQNNTQQVNVGYMVQEGGERQEYDFSKSTTSGTINGTLTEANTLTRYRLGSGGGTDTNRATKMSKSVTITVPHWPTENLSDLTSGKFLYNGQKLKYGQGVPLRVDNQTIGYMQISFDSSVVGILSGGAHSSQDLRIDMRKEDFLTSTANWVQGYKGLVNPDATSEPLVTLNGYRYTNTDGKVRLTVPMKKDESLWIRIAPWTSDAGYSARWSNLSMTMNVN